MIEKGNSRKGFLVLIIFGGLLFFVGVLFKIQHWPDAFHGIYSGPLLVVIGVIWKLFRSGRSGEKG